jgi:hypothetical protein
MLFILTRGRAVSVVPEPGVDAGDGVNTAGDIVVVGANTGRDDVLGGRAKCARGSVWFPLMGETGAVFERTALRGGALWCACWWAGGCAACAGMWCDEEAGVWEWEGWEWEWECDEAELAALALGAGREGLGELTRMPGG